MVADAAAGAERAGRARSPGRRTASRVGFIVNGYQLRLFDAGTGASLGAVTLIEPDGIAVDAASPAA